MRVYRFTRAAPKVTQSPGESILGQSICEHNVGSATVITYYQGNVRRGEALRLHLGCTLALVSFLEVLLCKDSTARFVCTALCYWKLHESRRADWWKFRKA